jgi:hypothetical protein
MQWPWGPPDNKSTVQEVKKGIKRKELDGDNRKKDGWKDKRQDAK